ncbi:uncharacterized protein C20orf96 homolog, partial [Myxocyprinus asiaticus]|uniref:uncharacterized protein C20orf96 homolog n=1 Tax=Myxocyprinus asiaticus TaxID=70543 RepID=UPI002222DE0B
VHYDSTTLPKLSGRRTTVKVEQEHTKDNFKALKLLITSTKEAIKVLEEHCEHLKERNLQIAKTIIDTERSSFSRAKELLIQQVQMGRSVAFFKQWSGSQIRNIKAELTDIQEASQKHLHDLQEQLDIVTSKVVKAKKELHTLKTYKDMEYPVKALQIADMESELNKLREKKQVEQKDVTLLFKKEMANLERCQRQREQAVLSAIAEKHESLIPPIIKLMASHNHTLREEIHMYRKEIMELRQKTKELMKSIQELKLSRPNLRREIFPDVFLKSDKCSPDMDVHLNIPQEDLLPI